MKPQQHKPSPHQRITLAKDRTVLNMAINDLENAISALNDADDYLSARGRVELSFTYALRAAGIDLGSYCSMIQDIGIALRRIELVLFNSQNKPLIRALRKEYEQSTRNARRVQRKLKEKAL